MHRRADPPRSLSRATLPVFGYEMVVCGNTRLGGFVRTQIPHFRLPEHVIDEEVGYITGIGNIEFRHKKVSNTCCCFGLHVLLSLATSLRR